MNTLSKTLGIVLAAGGLTCGVTPALAAVSGGTWNEIGDAGGTDAPQRVGSPHPNTPLSFIHGDIGGEDSFDVFTIFVTRPGDIGELLPANPFGAMVSFDDEGPALLLELFNESGESIALGDGSVRVENLLPGIYHIGVFTDIGFDPPFTITFLEPNVQFLHIPTDVPEPVTLGLLGAGFAGLGAFTRRKNK